MGGTAIVRRDGMLRCIGGYVSMYVETWTTTKGNEEIGT